MKLKKEPSNPIDSQAIAFMCRADKEWERIGYVVKEALPDVHKAIDNNKIIKIFLTGLDSLYASSLQGYMQEFQLL